ncbi:hypothetical protein [Endozoicomonas numazuensis]|uniref:hypothetical protein n=1 Tax=Endozoicomonas numazuensis TaxID=1137799 RepID=UPI000B17A5A1|nr:hypothetical protein [Endozoicomonas numazuensis]
MEFISQEHESESESVSIATLLVKPGRVSIPVDQHFAYEMDNDDLLIGYGLSWKDKHRNIPFIAKLVQSFIETVTT